MSRLKFFCRPLVSFDPSNKDHRRWFAEFNRQSAWGRCPVQFIVPDADGDLITLCQRRLIEYYVNKEFGKTAG
jgi:hypothetical protein